ncbi:hypothetical protein ACF09C_36450 [Streptomyces sp. NPDC014870]|uniref:hypothetical protein n=1 Tax=Streptomyces sp. NPDC014870 TaxID=3364925 RepID=UPI00370203AB
MREQIQHDGADRPIPGRSVEVEFAGILLQACDAFEEQAEAVAERDIAEALGLRHHPGDIALAQLTDRLLSRCDGLSGGIEGIPVAERTPRAAGVLETWEKLKADGPGDGPLGTWSYTRHLALTGRDMVRALQERRAAHSQSLPAFFGRGELPPIPPDGAQ